jgi:hypothetical protein
LRFDDRIKLYFSGDRFGGLLGDSNVLIEPWNMGDWEHRDFFGHLKRPLDRILTRFDFKNVYAVSKRSWRRLLRSQVSTHCD